MRFNYLFDRYVENPSISVPFIDVPCENRTDIRKVDAFKKSMLSANVYTDLKLARLLRRRDFVLD